MSWYLLNIFSCPGGADSDPQCTTASPVSSGNMSATTIIIIVVCTVGSVIVIVIIVVVSVCIYRRCNSKRFRLQQPREELVMHALTSYFISTRTDFMKINKCKLEKMRLNTNTMVIIECYVVFNARF